MRFKKLIILGSILFATWMTWSTVVLKRSAAHIAQIESEIKKRRDENARLRAEMTALRQKLGALDARPEVEERQIRDELGLVRADEVVFSFMNEAPAGAKP